MKPLIEITNKQISKVHKHVFGADPLGLSPQHLCAGRILELDSHHCIAAATAQTKMGDAFRDMRQDRAELRWHFGVPCPECVAKLPKAQPSILLPQQRCRIHGYKDARPRITNDDRISVGCTFLQVERAK